MALITFSDGRWVEMRPMYVDDELALDDFDRAGEAVEQAIAAAQEASQRLTAAGEDEAAKAAALETMAERLNDLQRAAADRLRDARRVTLDACTATSWGGPLTSRISKTELRQVMVQWRLATEDDAIPPVSGTSS